MQGLQKRTAAILLFVTLSFGGRFSVLPSPAYGALNSCDVFKKLF